VRLLLLLLELGELLVERLGIGVGGERMILNDHSNKVADLDFKNSDFCRIEIWF
jgi:hypothetical protein